MNQNLIDRIVRLMTQKMPGRRWRMTVTCLSAVIAFATTYALVLPGITMTGSHPSLEAEELTAVSGEELTVRVTAEAGTGETEKTVILIADGEGADLSASYVFDDEGICVITDEAGKEIELHRSARVNSRKKQVIDYWFTLPAGEETSFSLDLIDEVDQNRFAKLVQAVQESAQSENTDDAETGTPGTASASNAAKAAPAAAKSAASAAATSSNAARASWSNADIAEANAAAADPEERIVTEENDSGFMEILDGKVINDLADEDSFDDEDEERVRAALRLSAGIGNDYASSVKDAERNADKRGDAELKFTWTEKPEESSLVKQDLTVSVGYAKIAVICDDETVLPADARISAREIEFGTLDYEALAAQAAGAVAENAGGNEKSVTRARFFDITISDGEGNEIQPVGDVKVIITYEKQNASEDEGEMNVVHFGEDGPEVVDLDAAETADGRDSMEFTASSFSIYGVVYTVDSEDVLNRNVLTDQLQGDQPQGDQTQNRESSSLEDFVSNVVIAGAVKTDGKYHVEAGRPYTIIITFEENSSHQFGNRSALTYQMPEGLAILTKQEGSSTVNIVYKGRTYYVDYDYVVDTNGILTVTFHQDDPDFHRLEESTNVSFFIRYEGAFDESVTNIIFSDDVVREIIFEGPKPGKAFAQKSASYDETAGVFTYTVTVTADGSVSNVNVRDVITGDALIFNKKSVSISGYSGAPEGSVSGNGFDYTFASMSDGQVITITYTASVDFSKDTDRDGRITVDQTKNTVTVQPEDGDQHRAEYSREIAFKTTSKSDGTEAGTTDSGDKIIEWTIDYNSPALVSAAGDTIKDSIDTVSAQYMKYYGNGITVEVRDRSGNLTGTRQVLYTSMTSHSDSAWIYTIPASDTEPYSYKITYQTVVDMEKIGGIGNGVYLDNAANNDHGSIYVRPAEGIAVVKEAESFTTEEINWIATLNIPKGGLTSAVVTDTFPVIRMDDGYTVYSDLFKEDSLQIDGLLEGEDYDVALSAGSVTITFCYQADGEKVPGLRGTPEGRAITVRLTTLVNQDWLKEGYKTGGRVQNHTNTIGLNGVTDTATVTYGKGIKKNGTLVNGSFMYEIVLSDVSEVPVTVVDTFDTSLLEVDTDMVTDPEHMQIFGGNQYYQGSGKTPVSCTDTSTGIVLTADAVPMQQDGHYYPYYRIVYYLKLKEGVDLEKLAIANGGEYDLVNTAEWNGYESSFTYKTEYDFLTKELLNEGELGGTNRTAKYRITFNSARAALHNGEPMTMTDTLSSNLSVDYSSINIVTDPEGSSVPYSLSGGEGGTTVATFTVPDATEVVITYDALIIGNDTQTISNEVSVKGKEKTINATISNLSDTQGQGNVASFKIVKVDGYDAGKKLSGVRFKVFAEKPALDFGEKVNHAKEIELVTDENGEICLDGEAYDLYFNEVYHVQETDPPEGYGAISFDYKVTLTKDMEQVSYKDFVYYYSDSMQIKNWPLEGLVIEKQVESDLQADKDRYYKFRISILNDDDEVDEEYNEKIGDDQFENGVFEFRLKDKEQKMFRDFRKGTKYRVEEILEETEADDFAVSVICSTYDEDGNITGTVTDQSGSHEGELIQENEVIVFRNTKKGDLTVSKILDTDVASDADQEFDFTVTLGSLGDSTINGTYGDMTFTDGTAAFKLKGGQSATAAGLPTGITYTVAEAKAEGFELAGKTGDTGIITSTPAHAVFTNAREGSLSTQFEALKKMRDRELREDDVYSFQLLDADDDPIGEPKTNASSGQVTFDPIVFTASDLQAVSSDSNAEKKEKTFTWWIREVIPDGAEDNVKDGIKYDASEYSVSVTLRYNEAAGKYEVSEPVYSRDGDEAVDAAVFVNEELRDFEFSKVWMNSGREVRWPKRVESITVTLKRTAQSGGGSQSEETAVFTVTGTGAAENAGSDFTASAEKLEGDAYRYKITDLEKYSSDGEEWIYSISETTVEGFNKPAYFTINADGERAEQRSSEETFFAVPGTTGGVEIVNDEIVAVLPSTGGPGTMPYTLGGAALLALFALIYGFRMRQGYRDL